MPTGAARAGSLAGEHTDEPEPGGGSLTLRLGGLSESFAAIWFDTRSGVETSAGSFTGGQDHTVAPPSADDWVLLLSRSTDSSAPSVPSVVTASAAGSDTVQISWSRSSDDQSGVSHYRVYRDGAPIAEPAAAAYTDTGLAPGTSYAYEISAVNGAGIESSRSAPVSATTNTVDSAPPPPIGLQVD